MLGIRPELVIGLVIAESVYADHGAELTVAALTNGTHHPGSLHYQGAAADLRTHDIAPEVVQHILASLRTALGDDFDVVLEDAGTPNEHIHVEFQPKQPISP